MRTKHYRVTVSIIKSKLKDGEIVYYARYRDNGKNPQISLRGMNKHEAKEYAHKLELELNQPEVIIARKNGITYEQYLKNKDILTNAKRVTFNDLLAEHLELVRCNNAPKTFINYFISYRQFSQFIVEKGIIYLDEVNYSILESYKTQLQGKYKPATVSTKMNSLIGLFTYGIKRGFLEKNPFEKIEQVKIPEREIRTFSDEEIAKLLKVVKDERPDYYVMLLVALDTGARFNELTSIVRKSDFQFEKDEKTDTEFGLMSITNHQVRTKNTKNRFTPITHGTVKVLKQYLANFQDSDIVFENVDRSKGKWFKSYIQQAGLDEALSFHNLRKTALSRMANSGVDILKLCDIAGHSSIEITRKYYLKRNAKDNARDIAVKFNQKEDSSEGKSEGKTGDK